MPKKFSLVVVDDKKKEQEGSWARVFETILKPYGYMKGLIKRYDDDTYSMRYKILAPDTGFNFEQSREHLEQDSYDYDFYFFDLNFEDNNFASYPYVPKRLEDVEGDEKSVYVAGMEFLNILGKDEKPKVFFTGTDEAGQMIRYLSLMRTRWADACFGKIDYQPYMTEIEIAINTYLHQRQIDIIGVQKPELRQTLKARLTNAVDWDEADIRDDKEADSFWSLRTLFPKQINNIERGEGVEAMKQYIMDILDADWRKSIRLLLGRHTTDLKLNIEKIMETVDDLEFKEVEVDAAEAGYKRLTSLKHYNLKQLEDLRDFIILAKRNDSELEEDYLIDYAPYKKKQSLREYFNGLLPKKGWQSRWVNICKNYGIYPMDIAYVSHIAFNNARHLKTEARFSYREEDGKIQFIWSQPKEVSPAIFDEESRIFGKLNEEANRNPHRLDDCGYADIGKIVCWRYKGVVKFSSGNNHMVARRDGRIRVNFPKDESPVEGTVLQITISEPEI